MTKGWELWFQWKGGLSNWVTLKDLKNSYPGETAEYAVANRIEKESEFAWWIPYVINKRKAILQKVESKYWWRNHNTGSL